MTLRLFIHLCMVPELILLSGLLVDSDLMIFTIVPEQEKPDSNFSTVKFPNPEEPEAMQMALELGKD